MKVCCAILSLLLCCFGSAVGGRSSSKGSKSSKSSKGDYDYDVCDDKDFECPRLSTKLVHAFGNHVGIANRAGGTISLVDPYTLKTAIEYTLPDDGEPMYFAMIQIKPEIWVGDRANDRIVILRMKGCKLELDGFIQARKGVFHTMMTQRPDDFPIVVTTCDIDNVIVVHDVSTRRLLATLDRPEEAEEIDAVPHDTTTNGKYIFVSFLKMGADEGYVASYDAYSFELIAVLKTAPDPHMAIRDDTSLFIAAQGGMDNSGDVFKVSVPDLEIMSTIVERPSPHGTFISYDSKYLYTTNIAEEGEMAVEIWDVETGELMDCPTVRTSNAVPHNPTVSFDGTAIYITHSGPTSDVNSAFRILEDGCLDPKTEKVFVTNFNPFGIFIVPPAQPLVQCLNE